MKKLKIKHNPQFNPLKIEDYYTAKDGVAVFYIGTTEKKGNLYDVFYRETPHPKFGNHYFGLTTKDGDSYITNMDCIEEYTFHMALDSRNVYHYSRHVHDFVKYDKDKFIDGGRDYARYSLPSEIHTLIVKDGEWIKL